MCGKFQVISMQYGQLRNEQTYHYVWKEDLEGYKGEIWEIPGKH